jgi:aldehyde:ferredoxin oxidoreductase
MAGGYADRILRVDLSARRTWTESLPPEDVLRRYVGGTALALWYLAKETPKGAKAGDPEVPLIFMTGPLAGTRAPSSSNFVVVSLHYDIPYAAGAGHAHGFWAAFLKHAGYEGIIVTGAANTPVYLFIDDDRVEIRDATSLWGTGTRETERLVKAELGGEADKISVACIGQAGEAVLHGAMIKCDRNHGAGKGSPGALMGARKLKAIAVRGTGEVRLAEKLAFLDTAQQWENNLFVTQEGRTPPLGALWHNGGMTHEHGVMSVRGITAVKNLTDYEFGIKFSHKYMDACREWTVTPTPSYNCLVACSYDVKITSGEFAGYTVSMCGGGEPFEGAAGMVGVDDPGRMLVMTDFYDDIGMESGHGGSLLGMVWEAYNRGLITKEDTGGLELTWGNYDAFMEIWQQMIERRDFGGKLVGDMKDVARALNAEDLLVHVKGGAINMHDWRPMWGALFGQIIAGSGPSHQIEYPHLAFDHSNTTVGNKPEMVFETQKEKLWEDNLGVCMFACQAVKDVVPLAAKSVATATGWSDFTEEEAMLVGERTINLMRLIAVSRGLTRESDFDVGKRLLEAPSGGPGAGAAMGPYLKEMVDRYYAAAGWDLATGRPTASTIRRLGMKDLAGELGIEL